LCTIRHKCVRCVSLCRPIGYGWWQAQLFLFLLVKRQVRYVTIVPIEYRGFHPEIGEHWEIDSGFEGWGSNGVINRPVRIEPYNFSKHGRCVRQSMRVLSAHLFAHASLLTCMRLVRRGRPGSRRAYLSHLLCLHIPALSTDQTEYPRPRVQIAQ
jgi:hypothetical protein